MGMISGIVRTIDRQPIPEAAVLVASGPTHPDVAALTDARGAFRLGDLLPGRYLLVFNADGYVSVRARIPVRRSGTTRVRVTLSDESEPEI